MDNPYATIQFLCHHLTIWLLKLPLSITSKVFLFAMLTRARAQVLPYFHCHLHTNPFCSLDRLA